ncbi:uncharacterized protein BXZ73DRAFT_98864 [Epithele typhae]|uniref:uncharacterized protein n=1 Tax=Epithele typhae TaxID=378194 RepID=UPI00200838E9|nr:uncharacterized protein BXZ73DRAFT_98864 [Epithele typhae]KAH9940431.1 hypothetical protein BXZ73DRAFT_98864 [Epithele typhae]
MPPVTSSPAAPSGTPSPLTHTHNSRLFPVAIVLAIIAVYGCISGILFVYCHRPAMSRTRRRRSATSGYNSRELLVSGEQRETLEEDYLKSSPGLYMANRLASASSCIIGSRQHVPAIVVYPSDGSPSFSPSEDDLSTRPRRFGSLKRGFIFPALSVTPPPPPPSPRPSLGPWFGDWDADTDELASPPSLSFSSSASPSSSISYMSTPSAPATPATPALLQVPSRSPVCGVSKSEVSAGPMRASMWFISPQKFSSKMIPTSKSGTTGLGLLGAGLPSTMTAQPANLLSPSSSSEDELATLAAVLDSIRQANSVAALRPGDSADCVV